MKPRSQKVRRLWMCTCRPLAARVALAGEDPLMVRTLSTCSAYLGSRASAKSRRGQMSQRQAEVHFASSSLQDVVKHAQAKHRSGCVKSPSLGVPADATPNKTGDHHAYSARLPISATSVGLASDRKSACSP